MSKIAVKVKMDKDHLVRLSTLEGAKKKGYIFRFGYKSIINNNPKTSLNSEDLKGVVFFKKVKNSPFGVIEPLKDIPEPEENLVYDAGNGLVFMKHPDYGLIKLLRYRRKKANDLRVKKLEDFMIKPEEKTWIWLMDAQDIQAKRQAEEASQEAE